MRDDSHPIRVVTTANAEMLDVLGAPTIVKADGIGIPLFLAEHTVPPGFFVPLHVHDREDELFYVLRGEITLLTEGGEVRAGEGSCIHLPCGSKHGYRNGSDSEASFLVICRPGASALEMFRQFDRTVRQTGAPLTPPALVAICAQHGVTIG